MKTVAIIQARMGSSRLPNKVMMSVLGKPLLGWMLDRLALSQKIDDIIIATTTESHDDQIANFANRVGCRIFRGSENDVLDRYYQAACMVMPDAIARLTADCPLIDPMVVDRVVTEYSIGRWDFVSNTEPLPSSWPDGMDVSVFKFDALVRAWKQAQKPSEREHVTFHFWNNPQIFRCKRIEHETDISRYRLTLDYPEDFKVIEAIIQHFGGEDLSAIIRVSMTDIITYLDNNRDIFKLNQKFFSGIGWMPSLKRDKKLGF